MSATLPYLSQYDPISSNESAIYPLGVNIIAETLVTKLAPGVRERRVNPRYLTAKAIKQSGANSSLSGEQ